MNRLDRHRQYKEYRTGAYLMDKKTKAVYIIIDRKHPERTLLIRKCEEIAPGDVKDVATRLYHARWMERNTHWRHVKELRKNFMLLDKKVMQVLYGNKAR